MSIASEITRLQNVRADILQAIADKGVTVPADSTFDDCPNLIMNIPSGNNYRIIGNKEYRTVIMPDGKEWLAENLDFKFCLTANGANTTIPCAWYYNNDENTYGWDGLKYGLLYNWQAVSLLNSRLSELCPGWHIPTKDEMETLITSIGGASNGGKKLKSTIGWNSSGNGTDDYGFAGFPASYRNYNSSWGIIGDSTEFWTITSLGTSSVYFMRLSYYTDELLFSDGPQNVQRSLRLIRDT